MDIPESAMNLLGNSPIDAQDNECEDDGPYDPVAFTKGETTDIMSAAGYWKKHKHNRSNANITLGSPQDMGTNVFPGKGLSSASSLLEENDPPTATSTNSDVTFSSENTVINMRFSSSQHPGSNRKRKKARKSDSTLPTIKERAGRKEKKSKPVTTGLVDLEAQEGGEEDNKGENKVLGYINISSKCDFSSGMSWFKIAFFMTIIALVLCITGIVTFSMAYDTRNHIQSLLEPAVCPTQSACSED